VPAKRVLTPGGSPLCQPSLVISGVPVGQSYIGASLAHGPVGITTHIPSLTQPVVRPRRPTDTTAAHEANEADGRAENAGGSQTDHLLVRSHAPTLATILARIAARREAEEKRDARFGGGAEGAALTEALTAAVAWRAVWTGGAEDGVVVPMTYGFSWITKTKAGANTDWK
jgi:hypothetical protein